MFGKEACEDTKHGSPPSQMVREKEGQASFHFLSGRVLGVRKGGWSQVCCVHWDSIAGWLHQGTGKVPRDLISNSTLHLEWQQPVSSQPGKL